MKGVKKGNLRYERVNAEIRKHGWRKRKFPC